MSPITITALVIFAVTYILMLAFQKIRPYITVTSAILFVALGIIASANPNLFGEGFFGLGQGIYSYSIKDALGEIDWNVIMMIAGTMGTVYLFIESKMPQLMSDILISKMPNVKWTVVALSLFAGIGILRKEGYEVKTTTFMKYGVPFTMAAVITGYLLLWVIWA